MIRVDIFRNNNNDIYEFILKGHADYAKKGYDIVCSAVSLLVINTINSIEKFTTEKIGYIMKNNGGYIKCTLPNIKQNIESHDATLLLNAMAFGLKSLELDYSKYIKINDKEV